MNLLMYCFRYSFVVSPFWLFLNDELPLITSTEEIQLKKKLSWAKLAVKLRKVQ